MLFHIHTDVFADKYRFLNVSFCQFSFTVELWLSLDVGYTTGPYPLLCSNESAICVWTENSVVHGRYGDSTVSGSTTLTAGTWHNIIFRHSIEGRNSKDTVNIRNSLHAG